MNMVCPNNGKDLFLRILFGVDGYTAGNLTLRAYQNSYSPDDNSTAGNFTESSFTGYSAIPILPGNWNDPAIVSDVGQVDYDTVPEWECTGGSSQDMYGWYLVDDASGIVVLAQRFDSTRTMVPGAIERIDPLRVKLKSFA